MKTIYIEPSLEDREAHIKAILTLPSMYSLADSVQDSDIHLTNLNAPNLALISLEFFRDEIQDAVSDISEFIVCFRITNKRIDTIENNRWFTSALAETLQLRNISNFNFQQFDNTQIASSSFSGGLVSGLFIASNHISPSLSITISNSDRRVEINFPLSEYALPASIDVFTAHGTFKNRSKFESVAKLFWRHGGCSEQSSQVS